MIPSDVDIAKLTHSLSDANVVIESGFPLGPDVSPSSVKTALNVSTQGETPAGTVKTAYIANDGLTAPDLRDIAQKIKDATGADTVIVQSPSLSAVVSDSASRFTIESKTPTLVNPANAQSVNEITASEQAFLQSLADSHPPVAMTNALVGGVLVVAVACAAVFAALSRTFTGTSEPTARDTNETRRSMNA